MRTGGACCTDFNLSYSDTSIKTAIFSVFPSFLNGCRYSKAFLSLETREHVVHLGESLLTPIATLRRCCAQCRMVSGFLYVYFSFITVS